MIIPKTCNAIIRTYVSIKFKTIHLCCGIPDEWLTEGGGVGFKGLGTYYGKANMRLTYKDNKACLALKTTRPMEKDIILHLPTGEVSVPAKGRTEIKYQG